MEAGSRPAATAAARTDPNVQRAMSGAAVCRMNPSACSPTRRSALGPYAAIHTGKAAPGRTHGMRSGFPWCSTSRPSASPLITVIAFDSTDSDTGACPMYRRAESPRPIPQIVRFPNVSFSVANKDAMTDQSRVPGLVTMGPMTIEDVCERTSGYRTNVSGHRTCESNVHPWENPASSARRIIDTTWLTGGLGCSTTPNSTGGHRSRSGQVLVEVARDELPVTGRGTQFPVRHDHLP